MPKHLCHSEENALTSMVLSNFVTTPKFELESIKKPPITTSTLLPEFATQQEPDNNKTHSSSASQITETSTSPSSSQVVIGKHTQEYFNKWRAVQGMNVTFESDKRIIQQYVREKLFASVKFITDETELDMRGK